MNHILMPEDSDIQTIQACFKIRKEAVACWA